MVTAVDAVTALVATVNVAVCSSCNCNAGRRSGYCGVLLESVMPRRRWSRCAQGHCSVEEFHLTLVGFRLSEEELDAEEEQGDGKRSDLVTHCKFRRW